MTSASTLSRLGRGRRPLSHVPKRTSSRSRMLSVTSDHPRARKDAAYLSTRPSHLLITHLEKRGRLGSASHHATKPEPHVVSGARTRPVGRHTGRRCSFGTNMTPDMTSFGPRARREPN